MPTITTASEIAAHAAADYEAAASFFRSLRADADDATATALRDYLATGLTALVRCRVAALAGDEDTAVAYANETRDVYQTLAARWAQA